MSNSQGIDKNQDRVQTAHKTSPDRSASHEATRDPKLDDRPQPCELTTHVSSAETAHVTRATAAPVSSACQCIDVAMH